MKLPDDPACYDLPLSRLAAVPTDNYAVPICYAIGSIVIAVVLCVICHRMLRRRARGMQIDELPPQRVMDDRRHCYHQHNLLRHQHQDYAPGLRGFNQYQLEQSSPPSESDEDEPEEPEQSGDQETSSPDSV